MMLYRYAHSERFVKVHVTDITTTCGRVSQTNLGIEVGTIKVNLATVVVDNLAGLNGILASILSLQAF